MKKKIIVIGIIFLVIIFGLSGCTNNDTSENGQFRIDTFEISPSSIVEGEKAVLNWVVFNADTVFIDNGIGNVDLIGSILLYPTEDTTFTLTAVKDAKNLYAITSIDVTPYIEEAGVAVTAENHMIKITLTDGGDNMPSTGYTKDQIQIFINGYELPKIYVWDLSWMVGEALWIGGDGRPANDPELEDDEASTSGLNPGNYDITVIIVDTVIYDGSVTIGPYIEYAGVAVTTESDMIKITLTNGGFNMAPTGYTEDQIRIFNNGSELDETNIAGLGWNVGEALWVGSIGVSPFTEELGDDKSEVDALMSGTYYITVVIVDTVVYDGPVTIA